MVLASGYYDHPNVLGIPGEHLPHVSHYYDDPHPFYRKQVVVVGAKNSAAIAALELYRAGAASVTLVHRGAGISPSVKYWIRPDIENRIKEGSITARFHTCMRAITPTHVAVEDGRGQEELPASRRHGASSLTSAGAGPYMPALPYTSGLRSATSPQRRASSRDTNAAPSRPSPSANRLPPQGASYGSDPPC